MPLTDTQSQNIKAIEDACAELESASGGDALKATQKPQVAIIKAYCTALSAEKTDVSQEAPGAKGYARFYNGVIAFTGAIMAALFIGYPNTSGSKIAYLDWDEPSEGGMKATIVDTMVVYEEILGRLAVVAILGTIAAAINQLSYKEPDAKKRQALPGLTYAVIGVGFWAALPLIETMFIGPPRY